MTRRYSFHGSGHLVFFLYASPEVSHGFLSESGEAGTPMKNGFVCRTWQGQKEEMQYANSQQQGLASYQ